MSFFNLEHKDRFWQICPFCESSLYYRDDMFYYFFKNNTVECPNCKTKLDIWNLYIDILKTNQKDQALVLIGANQTVLEVNLNSFEPFILKFQEYGIQSNSYIAEVAFHCQDEIKLNPLEMTPPIFSPKPYIVGFLPILPIPDKENLNTHISSKYLVLITWVPNPLNDKSWVNIINAFDAYTSSNFDDAIIHANVFVESTLNEFLNKISAIYCSKNKVKDFFKNKATYSYQLNIILDLIAGLKGFPSIPDQIKNALIGLNTIRNHIAHKGLSPNKLSAAEISEFLCASIFGYWYIKFAESCIICSDL